VPQLLHGHFQNGDVCVCQRQLALSALLAYSASSLAKLGATYSQLFGVDALYTRLVRVGSW